MRINLTSIIFAILLSIVAIILYYLSFIGMEKYLHNFCSLHYCIDFLPFGDFLTIIISIISLYFVIISLNSWKSQLNHQSAQDLYIQFLRLEYDLLNLKQEFLKLKKNGDPQSQYEDYIQYIKDKDFQNRFLELDIQVSSIPTQYREDIKQIYFDAVGTFDQIYVKFLLLFWDDPNTIIDREDISRLSANSNKKFKSLIQNLRALKKKLDNDVQ